MTCFRPLPFLGLALAALLNSNQNACADPLEELYKKEVRESRYRDVRLEARRVDPSTNLGAALQNTEGALKLLEWLVSYPWGGLKSGSHYSELFDEFALARQDFSRGSQQKVRLEVLLPRPYFAPSIAFGLVREFAKRVKPQDGEEVKELALPLGPYSGMLTEDTQGVCRLVLRVKADAAIILTQDPCMSRSELVELVGQLTIERLETKLTS